MSRLLFAAARGARLQGLFHNWGSGGQEWRVCEAERASRIHPDDEHLQYGPVSTALRVLASGDHRRPKDDTYWRMAVNHLIREAGSNYYTIEERALFLLILAEALADEGL